MIGGADTTRRGFGWEPPQVAVGYSDDVTGRGPLQNRIARLVSRAMRDARDDRGLSRAEIASRMSVELGRRVSEDILDKWSSEASETHRIPFDAFIALVSATGADDLLGFLPNLMGFVVVPKHYKPLIELQLLEEHEQELAAHKARIHAELRGHR